MLGLLETVKLGVDRGSPVEPMVLVVLKGSTGFVKLGIDTESPVERMMLVILTELKGAVEGIDVRFETDGVRTVPVDRKIDEKLGVEMFKEVGIVRLGTERPGVECMVILEMFDKVGIERLGTETPGVERMDERVAETFPSIETEKPELGRDGVGRVIEPLRESDVVEIVVRFVKGELTTRELLGMEGIEGVPTAVSVVTPDKRVLLYSMIVWRALAVRVRVCILYIS